MEFHALGMNDLNGAGILGYDPSKPEHKGRGGFTLRAEDMFKFKVPQLYNLTDSPILGHGASFHSVREVVEYKNAGVPQNANVPQSQLSPWFKPLGLTDAEISDLVAFIEDGLHDPNLYRYVPSALPSGFCFPNNDPQSRLDRGCN
jgi:cytochrome c peroxidase